MVSNLSIGFGGSAIAIPPGGVELPASGRAEPTRRAGGGPASGPCQSSGRRLNPAASVLIDTGTPEPASSRISSSTGSVGVPYTSMRIFE
jgi:hypothetical protein